MRGVSLIDDFGIERLGIDRFLELGIKVRNAARAFLIEELGQTPICLQIANVFGLLFGFISLPNSHRPIVPSFTTCINFDN